MGLDECITFKLKGSADGKIDEEKWRAAVGQRCHGWKEKG